MVAFFISPFLAVSSPVLYIAGNGEMKRTPTREEFMYNELLSVIVGVSLIGIGFIIMRFSRNSESYTTRTLGLPSFIVLSVVGVFTLLAPLFTK